jgi:3-methyladenine DNA glycosylase AlkD
VVLPALCHFGKIKVNSAATSTLEMTNVGLDSARFVVKQAKDSLLQVKYKHGPVAPGMSVKLHLSLAPSSEPREITEILKVVSESEILQIPVHASILAE